MSDTKPNNMSSFTVQILELQGQVKDTETKVKELEVKLADCDTKLEKSERAGLTLTEEVDRLHASQVSSDFLQLIFRTEVLGKL